MNSKADNLVSSIQGIAQDRFAMPLSGIHGKSHWDRVHENGVYLAKHSEGDVMVVRLFAYLHDCCRESDGADYEHGLRAADFAKTLRGNELSSLSEEQFDLLVYACEFHERGKVTEEPTVGSCWDSDRLDLGRVAIKPNPKLLSTERAKKKAVIDWAYQRSRGNEIRLKGG